MKHHSARARHFDAWDYKETLHSKAAARHSADFKIIAQKRLAAADSVCSNPAFFRLYEAQQKWSVGLVSFTV